MFTHTTLLIKDKQDIVIDDLLWHYDNFGAEQQIPFVSYDADEELRYVKKMRKALKRVLKFYGKEIE